jgi:CRISPR system Cascade subunit CasD
MHRHLMIRLHSPLLAFGGDAIDNLGVTRDFPALSMVTGLFANALGWDRGQTSLHKSLQERIIMGSCIEAQGERIHDFQTAQLGANDKGWTTRGVVEERSGGASTYDSPRLRYRDYHADMSVLIALRLRDADQAPSLDDLACALDKPARPLFIGRKSCVPTTRLMAGWVDAQNILAALQQSASTLQKDVRAQWPEAEGQLLTSRDDKTMGLGDLRNWTAGVHSGTRQIREGLIRFSPKNSTSEELA